MIYRILGDGEEAVVDETSGDFRPSGSRFGGAFTAGVAGWDDLPYPQIEHPRARFWFTEKGWKEYGRAVYDSAVAQGHVVRVLRQKNPPESRVVYRDRFQVAIVPPKPQD
jgi:hypothetical protein